MIGSIGRALRPRPADIVRLADRESDPTYASSFEPLYLGPVISFAALLLIGLAGAVLAPYRVVLSILRRT